MFQPLGNYQSDLVFKPVVLLKCNEQINKSSFKDIEGNKFWSSNETGFAFVGK